MTVDAEPALTLQCGTAIHQQIQTQIRDHIVSGQLLPGEQLPSVRELAVELAVNPCVVSRALRELEREGFLTSEEGSGTFVTAKPQVRFQREKFEDLCHDFLSRAAAYGYTATDVLDTIALFIEGRLAS
jgi:GntR family transcriptional regulator